MKLKMFTIYDHQTRVYFSPLMLRSIGEAVRGFTELANDLSSNIGKYPDVFSLYELGEFDDESGEFLVLQPPLLIAKGTDFVNSKPTLHDAPAKLM